MSNPLFLEGTSNLPSIKRGRGCVSILVAEQSFRTKIDTTIEAN